MLRWASTWSAPFCASSSSTKIAVSSQYGLLETASTTRPTARSLSATRGIGSRRANLGSGGVVVGQAHQREAGQLFSLAALAGGDKSGELAQEFVHAKLVGELHLEVGIIRIEMIAQIRLRRNVVGHQRNDVLVRALAASQLRRQIFARLDVATLALRRLPGGRPGRRRSVVLLQVLAPVGFDVLAVVAIGQLDAAPDCRTDIRSRAR